MSKVHDAFCALPSSDSETWEASLEQILSEKERRVELLHSFLTMKGLQKEAELFIEEQVRKEYKQRT